MVYAACSVQYGSPTPYIRYIRARRTRPPSRPSRAVGQVQDREAPGGPDAGLQPQQPVRHWPSARRYLVAPWPVRPLRRLHPGGQGAGVLCQAHGEEEEVDSSLRCAAGLNQLLIGRTLVQCVSDVQFMIAKKRNSSPPIDVSSPTTQARRARRHST